MLLNASPVLYSVSPRRTRRVEQTIASSLSSSAPVSWGGMQMGCSEQAEQRVSGCDTGSEAACCGARLKPLDFDTEGAQAVADVMTSPVNDFAWMRLRGVPRG